MKARPRTRWRAIRPRVELVLATLLILQVMVFAAQHLLGTLFPFELLTHFLPHQTVTLLVMGGVFAALATRRRRNVVVLAVSGLCLLLSAAEWMVVYLPVQAREVSGETMHVRLVSANVHLVHPEQRALAFMKAARPDILILFEVGPRWVEAAAPVTRAFPDRLECPRRHHPFGMVLYSRIPLVRIREIGLPGGDFPAAEVQFLSGATTVTLLAAHVDSPTGRFGGFPVRNRQLGELADRVVRAFEATTGPVLLVGDLNTTMWSPYYKELVERARLRNGRRGFGRQPTWPCWLPRAFRIPLDHLLYRGAVRVERFEAGPPVGSDHLPILVDLAFPETKHPRNP